MTTGQRPPPGGGARYDRWTDHAEAVAADRLSAAVHRYFAQGARDGVSTAEAAAAWDRFRFVPRVLREVTDVQVATSALGARLDTPVAVAPSTLQRAADPEGEVATARAAAAAGALMVVSSNAGRTFEDIAATGVTWWLQMYVTADRAATAPVVERAVAAGARAVVLTADTPVVGTKYAAGAPLVWDEVDPAWLRVNHPTLAPGSPEQGLSREKATDLGPQDIAWLAARSGVPVVVKGVLHPHDARRCVEAGASAIWVSNHGGRQLDGVVATADVLPEVVSEVGDQAEVYVDGGLRRGRDLVAAAALGARLGFLGRPVLWGLAAGGDQGVRRVLEELTSETVEALRLLGCARIDDLDAALLRRPTAV